MKTSKYFKAATMAMTYGASPVIALHTIKCFIDNGRLNKRRVKKFIKKYNAELADFRNRIYSAKYIVV